MFEWSDIYQAMTFKHLQRTAAIWQRCYIF